MPKFDRQSIEDAEKACKMFVPNEGSRLATLAFLAQSISYANHLSPENWCINLDKGGKHIRLNVGSVYCVNVYKDKSTILCLKESVNQAFDTIPSDITFEVRTVNKKFVTVNHFENTLNCLHDVSDSVGCHIPHDKAKEYLPIIKKANQDFIDKAIQTILTPRISQAHSPGILDYLDSLGLFV
ncbi:hypothetical protein [uncultured Microscilla sp.]|uniref:hypothetical protein n=1 Tax=uncultured Microscilla sp. TaxID=432653 RepID=UPI0026191F4B|nr:hypothetical protein [uncultured Microscilla sp.]